MPKYKSNDIIHTGMCLRAGLRGIWGYLPRVYGFIDFVPPRGVLGLTLLALEFIVVVIK